MVHRQNTELVQSCREQYTEAVQKCSTCTAAQSKGAIQLQWVSRNLGGAYAFPAHCTF
jgi:hypothetical protein